MIKNPKKGMTVFSVFGILNKEHMYIGKIVDIHPEWKPSPITVQWEYPVAARLPSGEEELFTSMVDAKHSYLEQVKMELGREILNICNRYPGAMDADKGVEE